MNEALTNLVFAELDLFDCIVINCKHLEENDKKNAPLIKEYFQTFEESELLKKDKGQSLIQLFMKLRQIISKRSIIFEKIRKVDELNKKLLDCKIEKCKENLKRKIKAYIEFTDAAASNKDFGLPEHVLKKMKEIKSLSKKKLYLLSKKNIDLEEFSNINNKTRDFANELKTEIMPKSSNKSSKK